MLVNVWNTSNGQDYAVIFESRDYGMAWVTVTPPSAQVVGNQLLVVRGRAQGWRLYLNQSSLSPQPTPPLVSADDGATWTPLPVAPLTVSSMAANPADPDTMVYTGYFPVRTKFWDSAGISSSRYPDVACSARLRALRSNSSALVPRTAVTARRCEGVRSAASKPAKIAGGRAQGSAGAWAAISGGMAHAANWSRHRWPAIGLTRGRAATR